VDVVLVLLPSEHARGHKPVELQLTQAAEELVSRHVAVAGLVVPVDPRVRPGRVDDVAVADVRLVVPGTGLVGTAASSGAATPCGTPAPPQLCGRSVSGASGRDA
jgi:hypothetical protein